MEKRTMADIRREKFNKQGQLARELADLALRDIDDLLNGVDPNTGFALGAEPEPFLLPDPPEAA